MDLTPVEVAPGVRRVALWRGSGHEFVCSLAWSPDGRWLASGGYNRRVRVWSRETWGLATKVKAVGSVTGVAWLPGSARVAWSTVSEVGVAQRDGGAVIWRAELPGSGFGLAQETALGRPLVVVGPFGVSLWDPETGEEMQSLEVGRIPVPCYGAQWLPDGRHLASAWQDHAVRVWDTQKSGRVSTLTGHTDDVNAVACYGDLIASGSDDLTVRLWRLDGQPAAVLEGAPKPVSGVAFSTDGRLLASLSRAGLELRATATGDLVAEVSAAGTRNLTTALAFHPTEPLLAVPGPAYGEIAVYELDLPALLREAPSVRSRHYRNAKVVLVGRSGVGKTGLATVLKGDPYTPTTSTHGRHVWSIDATDVDTDQGTTETRETLLWDLAGQPGYRVFHRQHLDEVAVGLVLFDAQSDADPFAGVGYWARALDEATAGFPLQKLLVAARIDRGTPSASAERIAELCDRYGFARIYRTSAERGDGIDELRQALCDAIAWERLPVVTAPELFAALKRHIVARKEAGDIVPTRTALLGSFDHEDATPALLDNCLGRLEAVGLVQRLSFGDLVLLQPELLDGYGAWLAQAARAAKDGLGWLKETDARAGAFAMDKGRPLDGKGEEALLLAATVEDVVRRGIAVLQDGLLVFPSELVDEMPEPPADRVLAVRFDFEGPVRAIYATLAVGLIHAPAFVLERLYRNAAVFQTGQSEDCGFAMTYPEPANDARGRLEVFFGEGTATASKRLFLRYVLRQLAALAFAGTVRPERIYQCRCGYVIPPEVVRARKSTGKTGLRCPVCDLRPPLDHLAEEIDAPNAAVDEQLRASDAERERAGRLAILTERAQREEYDVFLCHNSTDKEAVQALAARLREQGLLAWLDKEAILVGDSFVAEIEAIIDRVPTALVVLGPDGLGPFQKKEVKTLFLSQLNRGMRLIPLLLPGADAAEVPALLRDLHHIDLRPRGLDDAKALAALVRAILGEDERQRYGR